MSLSSANPIVALYANPSPAAPDVARRALVLNALIGRAYGADRALLDGYLRKNDLGDAVTPTERALLAKDRLARQERIDATWLVECVQVLAWGLGLVDLDHFRRCDDDLASNFPAPRDSARAFVAGARLRPFEEIHRQCDLLYCLHWAVTEARLRDRKGKLDGSVIRERHRAINWLAGVESRWDEVSTDT